MNDCVSIFGCYGNDFINDSSYLSACFLHHHRIHSLIHNHESYIVSYRSFLHRRESGPRKVAWTHSHSASLGSLPLRAHHLPAGPIARSGKPAGSLVGGVMTSRKVLLCGEISEKMHFHLILEINLTFKIKIKHI